MRTVWILLASTILCSSSVGQRSDTDFIEDVGVPISELPNSVSPSAGKATLVADFGASMNGPISVYLINPTDRDLILDAQDGDVYLKLETKNKDGTWSRAQPHEYSWCGNSYFVRPRVRKGHFYKIDGYQSTEGEKGLVRFKLYLQKDLDLVTSEGAGLVLETDVIQASVDALAIRTGTLAFVRSIALGERVVPKDKGQRRDPQTRAILELGSGRFSAEESKEVLADIESRFPGRKHEVTYARERLLQVKSY